MFRRGNSKKPSKPVLSNASYIEEHPDKSLIALMNNLADGVIQVDDKGIIRLYNASSLNILDTNITLTGHNLEEILTLKNLAGNNINILDEIKKIQKITIFDEFVYGYETGENLRLELTVTPIRSDDFKSNKPSGYILLIRDITKLKSLEQERDEFINVVSHELRTPVTVIEATLSNLDMVISKNPDINVIRDIIDTAHDQIIYLAKMLNDISSLGRAESSEIYLDDEIDLEKFAKNLYDKYLPEAKSKNLRLDLDITPALGKIKSNKLYLEEIMQNLIVNAIKYTEVGSVTISIHKTQKNIEFAVQDTGIGIPKTERTKIFKKFYRVEDYRTRETNGTGLGLYVACRLAEKIKTKIILTSRLNHGSAFSFALESK